MGRQRPVAVPAAAAEPNEGMNAQKKTQEPADVQQEVRADVACSACRTCPLIGPCYQSIRKFDNYLCSDCWTIKGNEGEFKRVQRMVRMAKAELKQVPAGTLAPIHEGIACDGCGMNPLVGPRFMSVERNNYDLCEACCEKDGHPTEYNRIDRPFRQARTAVQSAPSPHGPSYPDDASGQPAVKSAPPKSKYPLRQSTPPYSHSGPAPPQWSSPVAPPSPARYPGPATAGSPGVLPPVYPPPSHPAPPPPYIAPGYQAGYQASYQAGPPSPKPAAPVIHQGVTCDGCRMSPMLGPRYQSRVRPDYDLCARCCTREGRWQDYHRHDQPPPPRAPPAPASSAFIHRDFTCDGCSVTPVYGLLYLSRIRYNYGLCAACYIRMGSPGEFEVAPAPQLLHSNSLPAPVHHGYDYAAAVAAAVAVPFFELSLGQHHDQHPHLAHQHSAPSAYPSHDSPRHRHHHAGNPTPGNSQVDGCNSSSTDDSSAYGGGYGMGGGYDTGGDFDPSGGVFTDGGFDPSGGFNAYGGFDPSGGLSDTNG